MQALAYKSLDNWPKALEKLEQSITLAVPGKLIRNFINLGPAMRVLLTQLYEQRNPDDTNHIAYIAQILALFSEIETRDAKADSSRFVPTDPLTTRELETLEYLATDLSTSEIAAEMGVTWSTLRTHIKNVYSKLDVHGRYEATLRAKELNLL
ncbi:MAG: LuxR C-terminal-related transcriptional regulator [Chloroflexota bacterium]